MGTRFRALAAAVLAVVVSVFVPHAPAAAASPEPRPPHREGGGSVVYADGWGAACRDATAEETAAMRARDLAELSVITPPWARKQGEGLRIVLRGTAQLEAFPQARDAFLRAAAEWEAIITTPMTIVIDVDFGPTRFGSPYPSRVIGSTDPHYHPTQLASYDAVRAALVAGAEGAAEAALYARLPEGVVQTTEGIGQFVYPPVAVLRAIGLEAPHADPDLDFERLGPPASIGFNSNFDFDFDPSDGVDAQRIDFTGAALHEIGHALGFDSWAGLRELSPTAPVVLTTWDLFRFRPGVTDETFGAAQRVTVSGGEQVFFAGGEPLGLSTGRPNATGGDGRQSSHWKDNRLTEGVYVGVMDPTLSLGERAAITANDVAALDWMGYRVGRAPEVGALEAAADGAFVEVEATVTDVDGDLDAEAIAFEVLDRDGALLGELRRVEASVEGDGAEMRVRATFAGLDEVEGAWLGRLAAADTRGHRAASAAVDLGLPDPDGPRVASAVFKRKKKALRFTGTGYAGEIRVVVNGADAAPRKVKLSRDGAKMTLKGTAEALGVVPGENVVRVYAGGKRSNQFVFIF